MMLSMATGPEFKIDISKFGVAPKDPGEIYVLECAGKFKIGRAKNARKRLRDARTWLPDMQIVGIKPFWNVRALEGALHIGFAHCWYAGEWFDLLDEGYRDTLIDGFTGFSDTDRDMNSVDFIYWMNGDGMAEMVREMHEQKLSSTAFRRQESLAKKK